MSPSIVTHLDHTIVVLRRSPARITSPSPSPRRRADGTLPRPQLDQEYKGRHLTERVLNTEVPYVRFLDRLDHEDVRLKEMCPRGNNKVVIYISLYHDKCLLFMLELY